MPNYCKLTIIGHVGQDPETRYMPNGDPVSNFSIAVTEKRGQSENTTWFSCAAFGKTSEIVSQYVHKGDATMIEGRISSRKFTDKDGKDRESWEVTVDRLVLLGGKKEGEAKPAASKDIPDLMPPKQDDGFDEDSIPF